MGAEGMMHAEVRQVDGLTFMARGASNHWVAMDTSEAGGGHGAGSSPMELVLMALGGCTGMDIVSILIKMQQKVQGFRVELSGERSAETPRRFTRIVVDYFVTGDTVSVDSVIKAIQLSVAKYCSVGATLAPGVTLAYRYHILRTTGEESGEVA